MSLLDMTEEKFATKIANLQGRLAMMGNRFAGLVDPETRRVLFFTNYIYTGRACRDQLQGLKFIVNIASNIDGPVNTFIEPWHYKFESSGKLIFYPEIGLEVDTIESYQIINLRCNATEMFLNNIENHHLNTFRGSLPYQGDIYMHKAMQARLVQEGETDYFKTYFVHGWSELAETSLEQAAADILFKHEDNMQQLFGIEQLRLKYTKKISKAESFEDIQAIFNQYEVESYVNASV